MFDNIRPKMRYVGMAMIIMATLMFGYSFPTICLAEETGAPPILSGNGSGALFKIIQPPPKIDAKKTIKSRNLADFFDVTGNITVLETDVIALGDRRFGIDKEVNITGIKRGDHVGLWLNKKGIVTGYEKLKNVPH
jgi:hypothetical protein